MNRLNKDKGLDALFNRSPPSEWEQFLAQPYVYLAKSTYRRGTVLELQREEPPINVVCISDTHNAQFDIPEGEILIHAGDTTQKGTLEELQMAVDWMGSLPHQHKILIAGNHELFLDQALVDEEDSKRLSNRVGSTNRDMINWHDVVYLEKSSTTLICSGGRRIKIYGNPMTPQHGNWAFQYPRIRDVWIGGIPNDIDILVTHGAPLGHLDIDGWGCNHLLKAIWQVRPKLHVFGHLHEGYGSEVVRWSKQQKAFEHIIYTKGGLINFLRLLYIVLMDWLTSWTVSLRDMSIAGPNRSNSSTLLVNAAIAGGRFDEPVKKPIVVQI